ncbi:hypothetical protein DY000_02034396 [Brassica cretica]|uniref:BED-type domain-containing protein n=1 Tax=Brassica cretica TaxID=69181 RepID=A0ABQ7DKB2_BRACR|nr:hypothetical protein DY000_02034396 [Brassica cretica]
MDSENRNGADATGDGKTTTYSSVGSSLRQEASEDSSMGKRKKKTSPAWENFTVVTRVVDGVSELRAKCNHCNKDYAYEPHKQDIEVADHGDQNESLPPFQV